MRKLLYVYIVAALVFSFTSRHSAQAETSSSREYLVKAAFLYNFAKFVTWPSDAFPDDQAPITLCIFGKDPFDNALDSIKGKTIGPRKLVIKRFTTLEDLEKCHMVFISGSEQDDLEQIFDKFKDDNVLTISDMRDFAPKGGIVHLFTEGNKIRFAINVDAAARNGLQVSSKLLKLAKIVKDNSRGDED